MAPLSTNHCDYAPLLSSTHLFCDWTPRYCIITHKLIKTYPNLLLTSYANILKFKNQYINITLQHSLLN